MDTVVFLFYVWFVLQTVVTAIRYTYVALNQKATDLIAISELDTVTIMLPTYNDVNSIEGTLTSICNQLYPINLLDVIVVDDGSTDGTHNKIMRWVSNNPGRLNIRVCSNSPNTGNKARAINPHVQHITGKYLVIIDGDGALDSGAVHTLVSTIKLAGNGVTAVSGSPRVPNQSTILGQMQQVDFHYNYSTHKQYESLCDSVIVCSGAISIFDTATFIQHDGLHQNVLVEDVVFSCGELFKYGNKTRYTIDAVVWTDIQPTWRNFYLQRKRWGFGIIEAISVGNVFGSNRPSTGRSLWQRIQSKLTILNMVIFAHIPTLITIPLAVMTGGTSLLVQFVCKSATICMDLFMGSYFKHGVPNVAGITTDCNLSVGRRFVLLFVGSIFIRCAMLSATVHHLTNRKKTWFTR